MNSHFSIRKFQPELEIYIAYINEIMSLKQNSETRRNLRAKVSYLQGKQMDIADVEIPKILTKRKTMYNKKYHKILSYNTLYS